MLEIVGRVNKERGMTVVMITQYMEEAVMVNLLWGFLMYLPILWHKRREIATTVNGGEELEKCSFI